MSQEDLVSSKDAGIIRSNGFAQKTRSDLTIRCIDDAFCSGVECQGIEEARYGTVEAWGDGIAIFICILNW